MKEKLCPLKFASVTQEGFFAQHGVECDKERCAWWFGAHECCSIPAIGNLLSKLTEETDG